MTRVQFEPNWHARITADANPGLLNNEQVGVVQIADMLQDLDQFDSSIHFDNCAFPDGVAYIQQEWASIESGGGGLDPEVLGAFGRLLHPVQDFYSHSNWVELYLAVDPIPVWDLQVSSLPAGIVSGTWILDVPKRCAPGAPTHSQLNKDAPDSQEGSKVVSSGPHRGKTLFTLAYDAAVRASRRQYERLQRSATGAVATPVTAEQIVSQHLDAWLKLAQRYYQLRDQLRVKGGKITLG